jgi:hypothetical protein
MLSLSRAVSFLGASVLVAAAEFNASESLTSCTQGACGQNGEPDVANVLQHHVARVSTQKCNWWPTTVNNVDVGDFVVLALAAITMAGASVITGDIGGETITGLETVTRTGKIFESGEELEKAIKFRHDAFTEVTGHKDENCVKSGDKELQGASGLGPGFYRWEGALTIPADLIITSPVIFHVVGAVTISAGKNVTGTGTGGDADKILWVVDGAMTLGAGAHLEGTVITKAAVTLGAAAVLKGRVLAGAAVSMSATTITKP